LSGHLERAGVDLSYWDLHGFLLVPTAWLLTAGKPSLLDEGKDPLTRRASFAFIAFILAIAVAQAFVWDSVGAQIGIWEFNPQKSTGLGAATLLPAEEIAWLFHHVVKAALWQIKMGEWRLTAAPCSDPAPLEPVARAACNAALLAAWAAGVAALVGEDDSLRCLGLVASFFAPVFALILNLGSRYLLSHWRLFVAGWLPPGAWTVAIDCVGQQQRVWRFPQTFLTGVATLPPDSSGVGLLKLDIAAVYLVSTFAVTGTGAIILAAAQEFAAQRQRQRGGEASEAGRAGAAEGEQEPETLWHLGLFILHGAAPALAERAAAVVPPSSSAWRLAPGQADGAAGGGTGAREEALRANQR